MREATLRPPPRVLAAAGVLLAAVACARGGPAPDPARLAGVRPTLEEVFLEPPISGEAPDLDSVSPDGRFALLRWSPPDSGELVRRRPLLLIDVDAPETSGGQGVPLAELLPEPGEGEDAGPRAARWAPHGHVLALARGTDVWLLDPASGRLERALAPAPEAEPEPAAGVPPREEPATEEPVAGEAAPEPAGPTLGPVASLRFAPGGRELRIADEDELFSIPLEADSFPARTYALDEARWWSETLDARALDLSWSRDLSVVFGHSPRPRGDEDEDGEHAEEDGQGGDDAAGEPPGPEVVFLAEDREVTLEGLAELEDGLDDATLSPDGRFVAAFHVDGSADPPPTLVPNFLSERVTTAETRRKLADDGPSPVRGYMWRTDDGTRTELGPFEPFPGDAPAAEGEVAPGPADADPTLVWHRAVGWAPVPADAPAGLRSRYAFERRSADFREAELYVWTEGELRRVFDDRDEAWLGGPASRSTWYHDGSLLLVGSESRPELSTPGRCQVFAIDAASGATWQVTEVAGEVKRFQSPEGGGLLVEASFEDPARRGLLFLSDAEVRAGAPRPGVRFGPGPYDRGAEWAPEARLAVFSHEELLVPAELWCAGPEAPARALTRTRPRAFDDVGWIRPVRLEVEASPPERAPESHDEAALCPRRVRAHVYLPDGLRLDRRPPAPRATIFFVHGAGYLQNVTDSMTRYPLNAMFHSRLARMGYPVVDVDYRGSAGYGRDFRTDVQYHLGGEDLEDIHRVLDELVQRGIVDPERVGLYGGSYGGFLTLMALFTAPERWAVGAALRSVTDWRTYHPGYTQPRLGRPSTHPEAYRRSSPIDLVEGLEDPLLVLHGMRDTNVFAQDSIRLIEQLIERGADFDAMLYPSQGHGFDDGRAWLDEYRRIERFLTEHLGPPLRR